MMPLNDPYEESYPPSLWASPPGGGGGGTTTTPAAGATSPPPPSDDPDGFPSVRWTKREISSWLAGRHVAVPAGLTKSELLGMCDGVD